MTVVTELDLPEIGYNSPDFGPRTCHEQLARARERGWLAHSPLAYVVPDAESGDFFLRARQTAFPGRRIAEIFGITNGPLRAHIDANILNLTVAVCAERANRDQPGGDAFDIAAARDAKPFTFGANLARAELEEH
jgi:hypothetical protein